MKARFEIGLILSAAVVGIPLQGRAQIPGASFSAEQQEADYRVIAARCGTPAFEKIFYRQSRAAVAAGLVSKNRDPVEVEKTVTALRRSPFVLVAAQSDCAAQMAQIAEVQKSRSGLIKTRRASAK